MRHGALWLLLVLSSCKEKEAPTPPPPPLQMLSLGAQPRGVLRYHPIKATKQTLELAIDTDMTSGTVENVMPTVAITLALSVDDVLADGRIRLRATVTDATAKQRDESRIQTSSITALVRQLVGLALTATLSPGGQTTNTRLETGGTPMPAGLDAQLAALTASFERVMMPLPDEPVGPGARWRNSIPVEQSGLKLTAVNTITLRAVEGDKLWFAIETQIHGDDQSVMQGAMRIDVKGITGTGTGTSTIDLVTLATTSQLTAELRSDMRAAGEAQATPMRMTMQTTIRPR